MKHVGIQYNTDNVQMFCIINVSYSNVTQHKIHVRSDQSDLKINQSSLSRIGPDLTNYKIRAKGGSWDGTSHTP